MKHYILQHQGFRGPFMHHYFETDRNLVWFAAEVEMFFNYNCLLSSREELDRALIKCQSHRGREVNDPKLEAMINEWCTTGDRWRADELKEKMKKPAMYIVTDQETNDLRSALWKEAHALGKNPDLGTEAYEKAKQKAKEKLANDVFEELMKNVENTLARYRATE